MPVSVEMVDRVINKKIKRTNNAGNMDVFGNINIQRQAIPQQTINTPVNYGEFAMESAKQVGLGAIQTTARTIRHAIPGEEDPTKTTALEKLFIQKPAKLQQEYLDRYAYEESPVRDFAQAATSIGYSGATGGIALAAGGAATAFPVSAPLATAIGGATAGYIAYGATRDQKLEELFQTANNQAVQSRGTELTSDEWKAIREANDYRNQAGKYGMYEAIPEAIGDVLGYKIFKTGIPFIKPLFGAIGKSAVGKLAGRAAATQITEQATELYTGVKQAQIDSELYGTEEPTVGKVFSEQWKPVALTTLMLGGGVATVNKGVDLFQQHKVRTNFNYADVNQRSGVVKGFGMRLLGKSVRQNDDGTQQIIDTDPMDIDEAKRIRDMYGMKQNPELYTRMTDMIDTVGEIKSAVDSGNKDAERQYKVLLDVLMSDDTDIDLMDKLEKVADIEKASGKEAANIYAREILEHTKVRGDLGKLKGAMEQYLMSPVSEYGSEDITVNAETEDARNYRRGAISSFAANQEKESEDIYAASEDEFIQRYEREKSIDQRKQAIFDLFAMGEEENVRIESEEMMQKNATDERSAMLDRMSVEAELAAEEYGVESTIPAYKSKPISERFEPESSRWKSMYQRSYAQINTVDSVTGETISANEDVIIYPATSEIVKLDTHDAMMNGKDPKNNILVGTDSNIETAIPTDTNTVEDVMPIEEVQIEAALDDAINTIPEAIATSATVSPSISAEERIYETIVEAEDSAKAEIKNKESQPKQDTNTQSMQKPTQTITPEEKVVASNAGINLDDEIYSEIQTLKDSDRTDVYGVLSRASDKSLNLFSPEELSNLKIKPWKEQYNDIVAREKELGIDFNFGANSVGFIKVDDDINLAIKKEYNIPKQMLESPISAISPLSTQDISNTVSVLKSNLMAMPDVEIVENIEQLPQEVKSVVMSFDNTNEIKGAHSKTYNKIYIIQPHITSNNDLHKTILHESIGHYGMQNVLGEKFVPLMMNVFDFYQNAYPDALWKVADAYNVSVDDVLYDRNKLLVAQELIAHLSEHVEINRPLWKRIVKYIQDFLYSIVGKSKQKIDAGKIYITSESDIRALIFAARDFVQNSFNTTTMPANNSGWDNGILEQINPSDIEQSYINLRKDMGPIDNLRSDESANISNAATDAILNMYADNKNKPVSDKNIREAADRIKWFDKEYENNFANNVTKWVDAIVNHRYGKKGKRIDLGIERFLGSPEFYSEKIPAYKNIFNAILDVGNKKYEVLSAITEKDLGTDNDLIKTIQTFYKNNKSEFVKLNKLIVENDRNKVDYALTEHTRLEEIRPQIQDLYEKTTTDPNPTPVEEDLLNNLIAEEMGLAQNAEAKIRAGLKEAGLSDEGIQQWFNVRNVLDNTLQEMIESGKVHIKEYEKNTGQELTDIRELVKAMGQLKGWYFPRMRKPGKYGVSSKKGSTRDLQFFNTSVSAEKHAQSMRKQGYEVDYFETANTPTDMLGAYQSGLNLESMLNDVINKMNIDPVNSLDEVNGISYSIVDYITKDRNRQKHIIVTANNPIYADALKSAFRKGITGDGFYPEQRNMNQAGDSVYHYVIDSNEADVKAHILDTINKKADQYLGLKDQFSAQILQSIVEEMKIGGFRSVTKKRGDEAGEEVARGYEEDLLMVLASYTNRVASGIAKSDMANKALGALHGHYNANGKFVNRENFESTEDYYNEIRKNRIDKQQQPRAYEAAVKQIEDNLRPNDRLDNIMGTGKSLAVLWYLSGVNVWASPFVNLTTLMTSVPASLHYHAGVPMKQIPRRLGKAMKDYVKFRNTIRKGGSIEDIKGMDENTKRFMMEITKYELDQAQFHNDIVTRMQGKFGIMFNKYMNSWFGMKIFEETERLNRGATMIAAFEYAAEKYKNKSMTLDEFNELVDIAKNVSNKAHGLYGKPATPFYAQGKTVAAKTAKSMYTFMKFPHTYLQEMAHLVGESRNDASARRSLAWMVVAPTILGGIGAEAVSGVLFAADDALGGVIMTALGKFIGTDDPEGDFYDWVEENFGSFASNVTKDGVIGALSPISVRRSLAVELPSVRQNVPMSLWKDFSGGATSIYQGDTWRGLEQLSPRFIKSPLRAYREYTQGATTKGGVPIYHGLEIIKPSKTEAFAQSVGFTPVSTSRKKEEVFNLKKLSQKYSDQRGEIFAKIRRLIIESNGNLTLKQQNEIKKEVIEFNKKMVEKRKENPIYSAIPVITSREIKSAISDMSTPNKLERARALKESQK